jgi:cysteine synthase B
VVNAWLTEPWPWYVAGRIAMAKQLGRESQGLLVGISAAAAVAASLEIAREEAANGRHAVIVTVLPDSADKYLSERFWEQA